jgi:hypothetical protein
MYQRLRYDHGLEGVYHGTDVEALRLHWADCTARNLAPRARLELAIRRGEVTAAQ